MAFLALSVITSIAFLTAVVAGFTNHGGVGAESILVIITLWDTDTISVKLISCCAFSTLNQRLQCCISHIDEITLGAG